MIANHNQYSSLNHKLALKLSISFSLLMTFFIFAKTFFGEGHPHFESQHPNFDVILQPTVHHIVIYFLGIVLIFYLLYEFCFWIFRQKWKSFKKHVAAFFGTYGIATLMCLISLKITLLLSQNIPDSFHKHILHIGFLPSLIVFLSTLFISSFIRNQQTRLENQRLVAENIRNRHEALKNQLNPHFLFNSLNTLDGLIGFDDEKAHNYLQNLSSTFRYTIQNKEITTLKDELSFAEAYAYLMKIRYGDNLKIQYAVDEKYNLYYITPLCLQVLIENAIKHNVINDRHPLTIHIETTEKEAIRVSNTIQPKLDVEAGEGIGLANLVERYHLLFGMDVVIDKNDVFSVEIPLIKQTKNN